MSDDLDRIFRACIRGDSLAWERLVGMFGGYVLAIARRTGLSEDACEDVAQTVFGVLARRIGQIESAAALSSWLRTTTQREAWRVRSARAHERGEDIEREVPESLQREIEAIERHAQVRLALRQMGGRCQNLIRLMYFASTSPSYEQLAGELGMPVGSIGPTRQRCLAELARLLGEMEKKNS